MIKFDDKYEQYLWDEWVEDSHSAKLGRKTTVAVLTMENGYEVVGTSACLDPNEYDREIGVHLAIRDALKKVAEIVGYLKQSEVA